MTKIAIKNQPRVPSDSTRKAVVPGRRKAEALRRPTSSPQDTAANRRTKLAKTSVQRSGSKLNAIIELMRAKRGASIDALVKATGWQQHSVRGAISGMLKKKLGLKVVSERVDGARTYRITK